MVGYREDLLNSRWTLPRREKNHTLARCCERDRQICCNERGSIVRMDARDGNRLYAGISRCDSKVRAESPEVVGSIGARSFQRE
jgi:hypothetical protein